MPLDYLYEQGFSASVKTKSKKIHPRIGAPYVPL